MLKRQEEQNNKIKLSFIYIIFGTIGVVTHFIPLNSAAIVFYRAILGSMFLIVSTLISGNSISIKSIVDNLLILICTGFFMGLNWALQFEAFNVSSVAIGTVCYNTMPIFLVIIASFIFKEKLNLKTILCIILASIGVVFVSNVIYTGISSKEVLGCIYGTLGAIFYALILIFNRYLSSISTNDKVIFQFIFSAIIMFVYTTFVAKSGLLFDKDISTKELFIGIVCIVLLGIFHTGFCYVHYFDAVSNLKASIVAILTYIDPVVALLLSYFVLKEKMNIIQIIGVILIFASTIINEFIKSPKEDQESA